MARGSHRGLTMHVADHQLLLFPPARPLAERFGASFFRAVPERPGVYLMSTARDGVLYVGKAKNLRRRLGSYRSGTAERFPRKLTRLLLRVERIDWDECADETAALARERELIRALQPRFNTMGVHPPKDWLIGWQQHDDTLTLALGESLDDWPIVRGPFVFARPAFAVLLRSLWLELHPSASVAELPSRLLTWFGPTRWNVPWSGAVAGWLKEMDLLLEGGQSRLLPSPSPELVNLTPVVADVSRLTLSLKSEQDAPSGLTPTATGEDVYPPLTFDEQWRLMDAECLADFHKRLRIHAATPP
jgi:predicted GIY-YIG superfamily endonuclease